jgi:flagellar hook-basal body complex protein FliE
MLSIDAIFSQRLAGSSVGATTTARTASATATSATAAAPAAGSPDFGSLLTSLATDAIRTVQSGEQAAMAQLRGNGSIQHTVEAIMQAEQNLQAAIAIRDKAVAAYQELSRMAI